MLSLVWLFVAGAVSQCTIPSSKIIASYDFTEYQDSDVANSNADSSHGITNPIMVPAPNKWLEKTNGIHVKNIVEPNEVFDMSSLTSFSYEIWYRSAKSGPISALLPKDGAADNGCPVPKHLYFEQETFFESLAVYLGISGSCAATSSDVFFGRGSLQNPRNSLGLGEYFGRLTSTDMHDYMVHIIVTVENNGVRLDQANKIAEPDVKVYVDGAYFSGVFSLGGQYLPALGWDKMVLEVGTSPSDWQGYLYRLALYNEALNASAVKSIFDNCLINNKPYAPSFEQYIDEDTLGEIVLNGVGVTDPNLQASYLSSSPYKNNIPFAQHPENPEIIYVTERIVGETWFELGTKVYDLEGGNNNNKYEFRITKMPSKFLSFTFGGSPVEPNVNYGPSDSVTLKYQAPLNEQSWSYTPVDSKWRRVEYDSIEYQVFDGKDWSNSGIISIRIDPRPDPHVVLAPIGRKVGAGSSITILLLDPTDTIDTFPGTSTFKIDKAIITTETNEGNLTYCSKGDCSLCTNDDWISVVKDEILSATESTWLQPPCLKYTANDAKAGTGDGNANLATDMFKYKLMYGDSTSIFEQSARIGLEATVNVDIQNPFYPSGNAPFTGDECSLVEDEKSSVVIDYNAPDSYTAPMQFEIMPLPSNFQGILYVDGEEWTATNRGTKKKIDSGALQYLPPPNNYTTLTKKQLDEGGIEPGYSFEFSLVANIDGNEFRSVVGTQKLCVAPRNDQPVIRSLKLYTPAECCSTDGGFCNQTYDAEALWSTSGGNSYVEDVGLTDGVVLSTDGLKQFFVKPFQCIVFDLDWDDPDEDPDAEYELQFTASPQVIGYTINLPAITGKITITQGDGENDNDLRFSGKYADVRKASRQLMKFKLKEQGQVVNLKIIINDKANNHPKQQNPGDLGQIRLESVRIQTAGFDDLNTGGGGTNEWVVLGITLDNTAMFASICGIIGLCVCCCIVFCLMFFKFQKNRIIKQHDKKMGGMGNFQGGLYNQSSGVDLHTLKKQKNPTKNQYSTPSMGASLKKM